MKTSKLDFLIVLLSPSFWLQNKPYSQGWDDELKRLLISNVFTVTGKYTAEIGGLHVWTANHPYASFTLQGEEVRPSRVTILRAKRKLIEDMITLKQQA